MVAVIVLVIVAIWCVWRILDAGQPFPTPNAVPATDLNPQSPVRAREFCSVAMCDEDVIIHLHVVDETWPFCLTHGMPYLIEERAA